MKTLVTGASGFVGSHFVKSLLDLGHNVTALTRSGQLSIEHTNLKVKRGDVTQVDSLIDAFRGHEFVYHLAGSIGYSRAIHSSLVMNNVVGTSNVIDACKQAKIKKLFYMSSVVAIGAAFKKDQILNENSEFNIHHLNLGYFETKHRAEKMALEAHKKGDIEVFIANPSTIYGSGDAQKGSRKNQVKVARGAMPFYTGGGVGIIHIKDVVEACHRIINLGQSGERFILNSENITIKTLFQIIAKAAGVRPPYISVPSTLLHILGAIGDKKEASGENFFINSETAWTSTLYHWFDNKKMLDVLKIKPMSAQAAVYESVDWMKKNKII